MFRLLPIFFFYQLIHYQYGKYFKFFKLRCLILIFCYSFLGLFHLQSRNVAQPLFGNLRPGASYILVIPHGCLKRRDILFKFIKYFQKGQHSQLKIKMDKWVCSWTQGRWDLPSLHVLPSLLGLIWQDSISIAIDELVPGSQLSTGGLLHLHVCTSLLLLPQLQ